MRILFCIPLLGCGGAEILVANIAIQLTKKGHIVKIVCFEDYHETWSNFPNKQLLLNSVEVEVINDSVDFSLFRKTKIRNNDFVQVIKEFKPDIIHSHLFLAEIFSRTEIFANAKYFSHGHDNMIQLRKPNIKSIFKKSILVNLWERNWLLAKYKECNNQFIAISKDVKNYLTSELPSFKDKIHYLPNAINTKSFHFDRDYVKSNVPFHIVSIANLVPKKNHVMLISILETLVNRGFNVTIDVYGFGPLMSELKLKTIERGLEKRLTFHGNVGEIPEKLKKADLYVHPAWYEPFGLVLLEAMASGLPVVSLDGIGNRELIENNKNGFMISQDSPIDEFVEKIIYFIENNSERERMGRYARNFAENYSIEAYVEKLINIYNEN
jgi:glycosyltransferase involved in cell wall biosynthesis